jgi:hypothetical protein
MSQTVLPLLWRALPANLRKFFGEIFMALSLLSLLSCGSPSESASGGGKIGTKGLSQQNFNLQANEGGGGGSLTPTPTPKGEPLTHFLRFEKVSSA